MWWSLKVKKTMWEGVIKNQTKKGDEYYVKTIIIPILDRRNTVLEYIAYTISMSEIMSGKKQLLNDIESNKLSVLALMEIEDYSILEKFHSDEVVNKFEKKFGNSLLGKLPNKELFKKIYFLGNGKFALLCDFYTYNKVNNNMGKYFDDFAKEVNKSKIFIDDIEDDLNIILSFSYGKHMLYEDAKQGLEEAINKKKIVHHSNDAYLRGKKVARL